MVRTEDRWRLGNVVVGREARQIIKVEDTEADTDVLLAVEVVAFEAELISEVSVVELEVELNEEV
jgi:hypothetical protein